MKDIDKKKEEALEKTEFNFKTIFNNVSGAVFIADTKTGEILECNSQTEKLIGRSRDEIIGMHQSKLHPEGEEGKYSKEFILQIQKSPIFDFECEVQHKDGRRIPVLISAKVTKIDHKNIIIGLFIDISNRRKAEEKRTEIEREKVAYLDSMADGVIVHDLKGNVIVVNPAWEKMHGYKSKEVEKLSPQEFLPKVILPDSIKKAQGIIKNSFEKGISGRAELSVHAKDGREFPAWISFSPIKDGKGNAVSMIVSTRDITERKRTEERMTKLNECFLSFGSDPIENINSLTAICGELLKATCSLYNRLEGSLLCSVGQWHVPADYNPVDKPDGHICYDVIKRGGDQPMVVRSLLQSPYAKTDPNVIRYKLQTYIGQAVKCAKEYVGSLCVVYQKDVDFGNDDKKILSILASAIAVEEERKRAEEALRESESKYRTLVEQLPTIIYTAALDELSSTIYVSSQIEEILGISPADYKADPDFWRKHLHPLDHDRVLAEVRRSHTTKQPFISEYRMLSCDGRTVWIHDQAVIVEDNKGTPLYLQGVMQDISNRREVEKKEKELLVLRTTADIEQKKLQELQKAYEEINQLLKIIETTKEGMAIISPDGTVVYTNQAMDLLFGYKKGELIGKKVSIFNAGPKPVVVMRNIIRVIDKDGIWEGGILNKRKDGTEFLSYARISVGKDEHGKIMNFLSTQHDITKQKMAEQELRQAYDKLKETQQQLIQSSKMAAIGQLSAGISHELNQPLTGIKGFAQAILMDLDENSPFKGDLNKIIEQSDRMDRIIKGIRFFARKSEFKLQEIDINKPIKQALMLLNQQLKIRNIRLKKSLARDLPKIKADPNQLQQVFINLITNARDAIESLNSLNGGKLIIESALSKDKRNIEVTFKDTGCGISKQNLEYIFNPFFTTKPPNKGIGLGLPIVYRIVENHKGRIEVESQEGKGWRLKIALPVI